ncbi:hypothetical protein [Variovorax sp. JS1663]|uniref:hypothetical protein n=1 Tax=Variovorax sp. JS1663 TaxID=1851577 RepID=UPI000B7511DD|nr:hypothetical protein [Variovorax sp. JS1663]OUM01638.1 hypothetical protein A8M77_15305 [Variovorax sp. JS1663]
MSNDATLAPARKAGSAKTPAPSTAVPAAPIENEASTLTTAQAKTVLETIAGYSDTLCKLLMLAQTQEDEWVAGIAVDAALIIATSIGALSDTAAGGSRGTVIGGHDRWNFGPNFGERGAA